jgi:pentatricopeptide repeat protein
MGEVYKARDTKLGREVAIKVLPEAFAENKERLARFEREARLLASLNHPNIATLFDLQEHDGTHFLVLEFVPGETLAERIKRGPIPVDEALPLFKQIAEGLEAAHEKGVILHLFNRTEEALAELKKAQELDPLTPIYTAWVGWLSQSIGDLENARLEASKALEIDPNLPDALYVLGEVYRKENAFEEAIAVDQKLAAVNPDWRYALAKCYAGAGRMDEALQLVADMKRENYPKFGIFIYNIQTILGNKDEALRALEAAFDYHHIFLPWTMRDSPWREDPRWQEMRRRLNLPE